MNKGLIDKEEYTSLCKDLEIQLDKHFGKTCLGFYIFGSCISEDYRNGSDIDFICFLSEPIDSYILRKVTAIHEALKENRYSKILEGEYHFLTSSPCCERKIVEVHEGEAPFIDTGTIDPDIVEMIRRGCLRIYGQAPQNCLPYFSVTDLQLYYRRYLESIYNKIACNEVNPSALQHALLNACRAYYCIVNNNYNPSKENAAIWSAGHFPSYKNIIESAISARNAFRDPGFSETNVIQVRNFFREILSDSPDTTQKIGFIKPMRTEIQVNTACNCHCPHCGYDSVTTPQTGEMSIQTIMAYLNEVKACWGWIDRVLFEGGEATLSANKLIGCIEHAKLLNIPNIQLNTNLASVTTDLCDKIIEAGCNYFEISVDAISRDGWQRMRGLENAPKKDAWYDSFCNNLEYLCNCQGVQIDFNYTPTTINIGEIEDVYRFACEHGIGTFSFQNLICTSPANKAISLSRSEVMAGISKCIDIAKCYSNPPTILVCCAETLHITEQVYAQYKFVSFLHCDSGEKYIYIDHKQRMRKCCFGCGGSIGKYSSGNFKELWENRNCPTGCMFIREQASNLGMDCNNETQES